MKNAASLVLAFATCLALQAHRLDEYLQATRIRVEKEQIDLAIDMTPGVAVAPELLPLIDPEAHPRVPGSRAEAYAALLLRDLHLELDGKPQALKLIHVICPTRAEMASGEGTIQVRAVAKTAPLSIGPHQLRLQNGHLPKISVYLVNALVPEDKAIHITSQIRNELQTDYRLEFELVASKKKAGSR
jgi:hypothetical protein